METFDTIRLTEALSQPGQQIRWAVLELLGPPADHTALELLHETALWVETGTLARTTTPHAVPEIAHDAHPAPSESPATLAAQHAPTPDPGGDATGCGHALSLPGGALQPAGTGDPAEPGSQAPAGGAGEGAEEAGGEVPADLTSALPPVDLGRRTPEVVAAIRALAAAGEPATSTAIVKASGIPRGSMTAVLARACEDGAVRRVETGAGALYELTSTPSDSTDYEAMKRDWLAHNNPSTSANLGPHAELVEWMKANMGMFIGRLPAGQRGRYSWRYGASSVSTTELYALGNAERARRNLPPIPRPAEGRR
ncbi:MAG: hypothetical protein LDL44_03185 [Caenispirillum sp.]|nr:hypothetical protein [Caenispirillum sp.]